MGIKKERIHISIVLFSFIVSACDAWPGISGIVLDKETNTPLSGVEIDLYKLHNYDSTTVWGDDQKWTVVHKETNSKGFSFYTITDTTGHFHYGWWTIGCKRNRPAVYFRKDGYDTVRKRCCADNHRNKVIYMNKK